MNDKVWIASFDIGKKNFAFCIEETDRAALLSLHKDLRRTAGKTHYNADGTPTPAMKTILDKVCKNGKVILFKNSDLTENCDKRLKLDPESFHNMTDLLDSYKTYWDKCIAFVIEEQMNFRGKTNPMALKLGQHCYSYFCFQYGRQKQVIEFHAYHKTQVLGAPKIAGKPTKKGNTRYKAMDKPARKKWSVVKAMEILEGRGEVHEVFETKGKKRGTKAPKKDDLADTLCQLQAMKMLVFVEGVL